MFKQQKALKRRSFKAFFVAGAEGLEPSARGFGDKYSFLIYSRLRAFGGHIGGHIMFFNKKNALLKALILYTSSCIFYTYDLICFYYKNSLKQVRTFD